MFRALAFPRLHCPKYILKPPLEAVDVLNLVLFVVLDNSADRTNLSTSACLKTVHMNGIKPEFNRMSSHKPYKPELALLDIYSGCGGMSTGLCLGAKLSGVDLVTVNHQKQNV